MEKPRRPAPTRWPAPATPAIAEYERRTMNGYRLKNLPDDQRAAARGLFRVYGPRVIAATMRRNAPTVRQEDW